VNDGKLGGYRPPHNYQNRKTKGKKKAYQGKKTSKLSKVLLVFIVSNKIIVV